MSRILIISALVASLSLPALAAAELSDERREALRYLLRQDCGSCHGMTLKGGLGPALLPGDLQGKPPEYLRHVIAQGVEDTPMPPWENILAPEEIDFLVQELLAGEPL